MIQQNDARLISQQAAAGWKLETGWVIDKDGGISKWSVCRKDPNAKSYLQKMSENAEKIREENARKKEQRKAAEEKRQEAAEEKASIEEQRQPDEEDRATLKEKMEEAAKSRIGDRFREAMVLTDKAGEDKTAGNEKAKEETAGFNLDMKI